jgi:hypothetical protein
MKDKIEIKQIQQKQEIDPIQKWKNYYSVLETYFALTAKFQTEHQIHARSKTHEFSFEVTEIQKLLLTLDTVPKVINQYLKAIQKISTSEALQTQIEIQAIATIQLLNCRIGLNQILADLFYADFSKTNKNYAKKIKIQQAFNAIETAWKIHEENIELREIKAPKDLVMQRKKLSELYLKFFPDIKQKSKVDILCCEAEKIKDFKKAFETFQKAIDLAIEQKDYEQAFEISCKQYTHLIKLYQLKSRTDFALESFESRLEKLETMSNPLLLLIELKRMNKLPSCLNVNFDKVGSALFVIAEEFHTNLSENIHYKDIDKKLIFLTKAKSCLEWVDSQSSIIALFPSATASIYKNTHEQIINLINKVEIEKKHLDQAKLNKEKEELDLLSSKKKYMENLHVLEELYDIYVKPKRHKVKSEKIDNSLDQNVVDSSSSSEEEYYTINDDLKVESKEFKIDLEEQKKLLQKAQNSNDILGQLECLATISEFYKLKTKNSPSMNEFIIDLKKAKKYLKNAADLIVANRNQGINQTHITWTFNLLEDIGSLLKNKLLKQEKVKEQFDKSRDAARTAIIRKYGYSAWYKAGNSDQELMSELAKQRLKAKSNLQSLQQINKEFINLKQEINIEDYHPNNKQEKSVKFFSVEEKRSTGITSSNQDANSQKSGSKNLPELAVNPNLISLELTYELKNIFNFFHRFPGEHYLVGSQLLDLLLELYDRNPINPADIDFRTLNSTPEPWIKNGDFKQVPVEKRLLKLTERSTLMASLPLEVWLDDEKDLNQSLLNGDFTISALACDKYGKVFDPTGLGLEDLKARRLIMIDNNPAKRFQEDALGILRVLKYSIKGFTPDQSIIDAIHAWQPSEKANLDKLHTVTKKMLFKFNSIEKTLFIQLLKQYGLLAKIYQIPNETNSKEALAQLTTKLYGYGIKFFNKPQDIIITNTQNNIEQLSNRM